MNLVAKKEINNKKFLSEKKSAFWFCGVFFTFLVLPQMLFEVFLQVYLGKSLIYSIWSYVLIALVIFCTGYLGWNQFNDLLQIELI